MGLGRRTSLGLLLLLSCFSFYISSATDTITFSRPIRDSESLISNSSTFRLGFFSPPNSSQRYVGIWYNNIPVRTVVWVANQNSPVTDSSGVFSISDDGNLIILNGKNQILWSTDVSASSPKVNNTTAKLLDYGNLVLQESSRGEKIIWESFQHPCDTFLPRMIMRTNTRTGEKIQLTSWKSPTDPSTGSYSHGIVPLNVPEIFIWRNNIPVWRSGPWNGQVFIGIANIYLLVFSDGFNLQNDNQGTASLTNSDDSYLYYFKLVSEGKIEKRQWDDRNQTWTTTYTLPSTKCEYYGKCGEFGSCNTQKDPICSCIKEFEPKNPEEWNRKNWTNGCVRRVSLQCQKENNNNSKSKKDGFLTMHKMKMPDFAQRSKAGEEECPRECLSTCSCVAYAYDRGIGCMFWNGRLIDTQENLTTGADLYIRVADSELDKRNDRTIIIVPVAVIGMIIITAICVLLTWKLVANHRAFKMKRNAEVLFGKREAYQSDSAIGNSIYQVEIHELPLYEFKVLAMATGNFDLSNQIGEGGFGPVYKGTLQDGQEIAVKRLSKGLGQGLEEFMNEVIVISKVQHRNLVRLLGCCIEKGEKMLVYEFMPNNSLDAFLFDPKQRKFLNWRKRCDIIEGICRGLIYLHRDSRLKIIHRDLKAGNILLDQQLNPKISDFGTARIFRGNEDQANTKTIVGTYGYMSPEYAMEGQFSEKSDAFSLGVLLLEIVSGRRNSSFLNSQHSLSLLVYAWKLWNDNSIEALVDPTISYQDFENEIRRCVQIALLCVQESANDRLSVSTVIQMLSNENLELPAPKQPPFIGKRKGKQAETSQQTQTEGSINEVTVTIITGR